MSIVIFAGIFAMQDAIAQVKIGYTNPSRILSQLPEVEEVDAEIQILIEESDQELAERATSLQQIFSDYESTMQTLSEQERSTREQELLEMNQEFEQDREAMMNQVRQRRAQLMAPIIERMNQAMEEVATEMGFDMILNEGTSYGDAIIFFAKDEGFNVTDEILEKLNNNRNN